MKKIIMILSLVLLATCFFAISVSAETPSDYIEFGARFEGSDQYISVYTENAEGDGNPRINFKDYKFYSDVDFTQEVDMSTVTGLDFSVAKVYGSNNPVTRITKPGTPFTKCTEIKWFTADKAMEYSIPGSLFKGFTALEVFDFGNVTKICDNAFESTGFESIVIPATITQIQNSAFAKCQNLVSVKFEGSMSSIGLSTFASCTKLTSVDLGTITVISSSMFNGCSSLTSITIPSTVLTISSEAFLSCSALKSVTFNDGLTSIGSRAFESASIESLVLPSTLTVIGSKAFYNSASLKSVTIPAGFTLIDDYAFQNCQQLATVTFLGNAGEKAVIDQAAFEKCTALTTLVIPEGVTTLGNCVCKNAGIQYLTLPTTLSVLNGSEHFNGSSLLSVVGLENTSITKIPYSMFRNQRKWNPSVVKLPSAVTVIDQYGFADCGMEVFIFSPVVEKIGTEAFVNCKNLKEVYLPSTITSISSSAFANNLRNDIVFFVTSNDEEYLNTVLNGVKADDPTDIVPLSVYNLDKNAYIKGRHLISGYSLCEAFYNGAHEYKMDIIYSSYHIDGIKATTCGVEGCTLNETTVAKALFTCLGSSTSETDSSSMVLGFTINSEAISEYTEVTGKSIKYGVFAVAEQVLLENDIFNENGSVATGVVSWEILDQSLVAFDLKIIGLETDAQKNAKLIIGAFVKTIIGEKVEYSYMQEFAPEENEKYFSASYNDLFVKTE